MAGLWAELGRLSLTSASTGSRWLAQLPFYVHFYLLTSSTLPGSLAAPPASRRFSLPLQTIDSSVSLSSMAPGGGEGEPLRPLGHHGPSPLGLPAGQASAPSSSYARSHSGGLTAGEGSVGGGSTASIGHEEPLGKLSPFGAPAAVAATGR